MNNEKKQTLSDWAFEFKLRLLGEKYYEDENLYTYEQYKNIVPRDVEVAFAVESSSDTDVYGLVKVENNEIIVSQKFIEEYKEFKKLQLKMELAEKEFKEVLKEKMQELGKTSLIKDGMSIIYKKATTRTSIDTTRLKNELPDIYENYSKTSDVSASITISVEL